MKILPTGIGEWVVFLLLVGGAVSGVRSCRNEFKDGGEDSAKSAQTAEASTATAEALPERRGSALDFDEVSLGETIGRLTYQVAKGKSILEDPYACEKVVRDLVNATMSEAIRSTANSTNDTSQISYTDDGFTCDGHLYPPSRFGYTYAGWRTAVRAYRAHTEKWKAANAARKDEDK